MSPSPPKGLHLTEAQKFDWLRLARSENIGPRTFRTLINRFGSAAAALDALPDLTRNKAGRVIKLATAAQIEQEFEAASRLGARFVALGEPDYPALLQQIDSAPPILAIRGNLAALARPAVAIVGARNASASGLAFTERVARGVAQAGYVVVSGLARGIDTRAHQATVETGTVAVLAGGHDRLYPADQGPLLARLLERGAAVSEMPFGWEARGRDFPRRNRIVSGLAYGTVVIEAARRSGSLITARFAAEQGREVFAVPGSPLDPRSEGTNDLLRDGATFCLAPSDVIAALARQIEDPSPRDLFSEPQPKDVAVPLWDELDLFDVPSAPTASEAMLQSEEPAAAPLSPMADAGMGAPAKSQEAVAARIVELLGRTPVSIDELARASAAPAGDVRAVLLTLELDGRLERHGGNLVSLA